MPNNIQKGNVGEELATDFLLKKGYGILEKNWRYNHLEIDIIASINNTLVVVEVKLRANDSCGKPEDFVTKAKQKNLIKAANYYIQENNINWETRFDIIAITQNPGALQIEHIEQAFYPTLK